MLVQRHQMGVRQVTHATPAGDARRPNIVFIFTDQHSRSSLGCYGSTICNTPVLNSLAASGVVFDHAYTTCPVCAPARASLQTGLYPNRHGILTNIFDHGCMLHELPDRPTLLSRRLAARGYSAGYTGKWHLGYGKRTYEDPYWHENYAAIDMHMPDVDYPDFYRQGSSPPTDLGYEGDDFPGHGGGGHAYPLYLRYLQQHGLAHTVVPAGRGYGEVVSPRESTIDHFLVERAKKLVDTFRTRPQPFFVALNFWGPHGPAYVPTEFFEPYRGKAIPPWPNFKDDLANKPRIHNVKRNRTADWAHFEDHLRYYYGYVSYLDAEIGRLLDHLKQCSLDGNTWIIFAADHGDSMGIHAGLSDKSFYLFEETCSIPLIIRPPTGCPPRRVAQFANTTDIYSTILDLAGVPDDLNRRDGRSLLPLVRNEQPADWPQTVVTEASGLSHCLFSQRMIRRGDVKYVFNCGDIDELYDLDADPHELRNLVVEQQAAGLLREMRRELCTWMRSHRDGLIQHHHMIVPLEEQ
ncbi:MAG TPA: sulfatase-like hydrolase/transferase [Planctomycetota bacterium]|nr:sulfatase-like hydrolase/transferase [Planctomycetota bacterium]